FLSIQNCCGGPNRGLPPPEGLYQFFFVRFRTQELLFPHGGIFLPQLYVGGFESVNGDNLISFYSFGFVHTLSKANSQSKTKKFYRTYSSSWERSVTPAGLHPTKNGMRPSLQC